ncbi:MAG: transposase, partial [Planctomycetes bacterium]|nr:transposase [Planctomycetota bacterium]
KPKGWKASQRARKGIEKIFGWLKQVGGLRRTRLKERWEPRLQALAAAATYNLLRLASLGLA